MHPEDAAVAERGDSVSFRRETPFGSRVRVMPPLRSWPRGEHPVAAELRERIAAARQAAGLAAVVFHETRAVPPGGGRTWPRW